jgi:Uma2 family endonuclease
VTTVLTNSALTWADVLRTWGEIKAPVGWRPEITPDRVFISPPPSSAHILIAETVDRAFVSALDDDLGVFHALSVGVSSVGGIFMPDLSLIARERVPQDDEPVASEHVVLVVEITSRANADRDRRLKRRAYARGGVAQYLLIDAYDEDGPTVSLFSNPAGGVYRRMVGVAFGQVISLAAPVKVDLDTAPFPTN